MNIKYTFLYFGFILLNNLLLFLIKFSSFVISILTFPFPSSSNITVTSGLGEFKGGFLIS